MSKASGEMGLPEAAEPDKIDERSHPPEDGAASRLEVKETVQELLRAGYIEEDQKPVLFRRAVIFESEMGRVLEPLDLAVRLDTHRGVAFLAVAGDPGDQGDKWAHPLVRRQRLTLEQSLLVAMLRQAFVIHEQEAGVGHSAARIAVEDLLPQFLTYFEDTGSDAKNESRLCHLLDQLKTYGIVSEIDKNQEVVIRPMIAHLANPESLGALLQVLREKADDEEPSSPQA